MVFMCGFFCVVYPWSAAGSTKRGAYLLQIGPFSGGKWWQGRL
jgi:hypothetical protein